MGTSRQPLDPCTLSLRNSAIGAAVFGVFLVFGIVRLHNYAAFRDVAGENENLVWAALIVPALAFLLAIVNWRAYRRRTQDSQD